MPWSALLKTVSLGYLTGMAAISLATLLWALLRPRIAPALRADTGFGILLGVFILNGAIAVLIWIGVVSGRIMMTTNYFHRLMYGGWSLAITGAGILLLLLSVVLAWHNWRRGRVPASPGRLSEARGLKMRESAHVATLSLVGVWQPELWFNPQYWSSLDERQRNFALHHERTHLRRHDTLRLLVISFISGIYAVLPWTRSWSSTYEADSELAVDDRCRQELGDAGYSELVLKATEHSLAWKSSTVASHLSQVQHAERLRLLAEPRRRQALFPAAFAGYAVVLLSILPATLLMFNPLSRCLCACYLGY